MPDDKDDENVVSQVFSVIAHTAFLFHLLIICLLGWPQLGGDAASDHSRSHACRGAVRAFN